MLASEMIGPLLSIERTVEVWSSLLPRLPSLPSSEAAELVDSVDMVAESKSNFETPSKKQRALGQVILNLNDLSFLREDIAVTQDTDDLIPLLCSRINELSTLTKQLRQGFTTSSSGIGDDVSKIHLDLSLLRNNLGSDPGLTSFPLRSAWEGNLFTKDALTELSVKILPVITPLSIAHVTTLVNKAINPFQGFITSLTTRLDILEQLFVDRFSPLDRLYSAVSGGSTQPLAAMLDVRLNKIGLRLSSLEQYRQPPSSAGLGSLMDPTPPSHLSTQLVEL